MKRCTCFLSLILLLWPSLSMAGGEEARLYRMAQKDARAGNFDFAYMNYRNILVQYPDSKYRNEALFAKSEYHFYLPDYKEARKSFIRFKEEYPEAESKLFALAYLLKMAQIDKDVKRTEELEKEIVNFHQVSLIFRDYKEYQYQSPLHKKHRAVFHIDQIEFFVGGELLAEISY